MEFVGLRAQSTSRRGGTKLSQDVKDHTRKITKSKTWKEAVKLMQPRIGVILTVYQYSAAMSVCSRNGKWEQALKLFNTMIHQHIEPNVVTFNAALNACARGKQWKKAVSLLSQMEDRDIVPNRISYNAAISACEKGNQWEKALEPLPTMDDRGLFPM